MVSLPVLVAISALRHHLSPVNILDEGDQELLCLCHSDPPLPGARQFGRQNSKTQNINHRKQCNALTPLFLPICTSPSHCSAPHRSPPAPRRSSFCQLLATFLVFQFSLSSNMKWKNYRNEISFVHFTFWWFSCHNQIIITRHWTILIFSPTWAVFSSVTITHLSTSLVVDCSCHNQIIHTLNQVSVRTQVSQPHGSELF